MYQEKGLNTDHNFSDLDFKGDCSSASKEETSAAFIQLKQSSLLIKVLEIAVDVSKEQQKQSKSGQNIEELVGENYKKLSDLVFGGSRDIFHGSSYLTIKGHHIGGDPLYKKLGFQLSDTYGPDFVLCLEDGKKMKMLKRHLHTCYGMTLTEYKRKWGLPDDYPTTAPNYSIKRQNIARKIKHK